MTQIRRTESTVWEAADGTGLIRLTNDGKCTVLPASVDLEKLRALYQACYEAIAALELIRDTPAEHAVIGGSISPVSALDDLGEAVKQQTL